MMFPGRVAAAALCFLSLASAHEARCNSNGAEWPNDKSAIDAAVQEAAKKFSALSPMDTDVVHNCRIKAAGMCLRFSIWNLEGVKRQSISADDVEKGLNEARFQCLKGGTYNNEYPDPFWQFRADPNDEWQSCQCNPKNVE